MRVTVTGGLGYIGACVVEELTDGGHDVRVLDSLLHGQEDVAAHVTRLGAEIVRGDVRDAAACARRLRGRGRGRASRGHRRETRPVPRIRQSRPT